MVATECSLCINLEAIWLPYGLGNLSLIQSSAPSTAQLKIIANDNDFSENDNHFPLVCVQNMVILIGVGEHYITTNLLVQLRVSLIA